MSYPRACAHISDGLGFELGENKTGVCGPCAEQANMEGHG